MFGNRGQTEVRSNLQYRFQEEWRSVFHSSMDLGRRSKDKEESRRERSRKSDSIKLSLCYNKHSETHTLSSGETIMVSVRDLGWILKMSDGMKCVGYTLIYQT